MIFLSFPVCKSLSQQLRFTQRGEICLFLKDLDFGLTNYALEQVFCVSETLLYINYFKRQMQICFTI